MNRNNLIPSKRTLVVSCGWALILTQSLAHAVTHEIRDKRPRINLFPTSVVESLSETSRAAREMESGMYEVVAKLEKQQQAYKSTRCEGSDDKGCVQLRKAIRGTYKEMLGVMQESIPEIRSTLDTTANSMGASLRSEIGRKMTPGDVQRILAGRNASSRGIPSMTSSPARQGKLSKMFSRYYELVKRGGKQADALPVLASQIYLDSMESLYFLDLIEAEIGSQSTELVLELEWGELTDQISATVTDVKALLWGETDRSEDILEVGLEEPAPQDTYADLLVK
jgi:hypothetical protein